MALFGGTVRTDELSETRAAWEAAEALWTASPLAEYGVSGLALSLMDDLATLAGRLPAAPVFAALFDAALGLLDLEEIGGIDPAWPVIERDVSEAVVFRRLIARRRRWATDFDRTHAALRRSLLTAFRAFADALPEQCFADDGAEGMFEVPLAGILDRPAQLIETLTVMAFSDEAIRADLFGGLRERIGRNLRLASGLPVSATWEASRNRFIMPTRHKSADAIELADLYLSGTPLRGLLELPVPFKVPEETRFEHAHIVGGTGHGKTQLMQRMIHADLVAAKEDGRSVVVIDSQGDLISKLVRLDLFDPNTPGSLADRLVLIDPSDVEFPAALNLFDAHLERVREYRPLDRERVLNGVVELYETFFGDLLGAELTQKQGVIFKYLARLMVSMEGATIHTLMRLMEDGKSFKPYMDQLDGSARYFFQTEFLHPSFAATKKQILRRLWGVLSTPAFERMFAQAENKLDLFEATQAGKIVLVSTAKDLLKKDGSALFGRFFVAMLAQAALERSTVASEDRTPTYVYVDEAQEYFDDNVETLLTQARKYRVSFTAAHQSLDQLSPRLRSAFMANTSLKFAGGVSAKDARSLADELRTTPDFIEGMRRRPGKTEFAVWVRQELPHAIRLSVPLGHVERQPTLTDEAYDALIDRNRARYCGTLADVPTLDVEAAPPAAAVPEPARGPEPARAPEEAAAAPIEPRPEPRPVPEPPREAGKGGPKHRYLQQLVKELGEQQGFRATVEAKLSGGLQADVLLERDGLAVPVEVSVSTPVEWELRSVRAYLAAGYPRVAVLLAKTARVGGRFRENLMAALKPDERERVSLLAPEEVPDFIASLGPPLRLPRPLCGGTRCGCRTRTCRPRKRSGGGRRWRGLWRDPSAGRTADALRRVPQIVQKPPGVEGVVREH